MEESTKTILKAVGKTLFNAGKEIAPIVATAAIYKKVFGHRIETPKALTFYMEDFPNLYRTRFTFNSKDKKQLVGYMYFYLGVVPKALIVFAHGFGGGGQRSYMDVIDHLAALGYAIFAYDATANDESEGEELKGFPQQTKDLQAAIKFVRTIKYYKDLPMLLFGHSMGAYAVSCVLNFEPKVKGVIAVSGFNKTSEIIKQHASEFGEIPSNNVLSTIEDYEKSIFGKYARVDAISGFKNTRAKVLVIHSEDDKTIPISSGYNLYYKEFRNSPRFTFIKLENSGHGTVFYSKDGVEYANHYYQEYKEFTKNKDVTNEQIDSFVNEHLDRYRYASLVDIDLFDKIDKFIKKCI